MSARFLFIVECVCPHSPDLARLAAGYLRRTVRKPRALARDLRHVRVHLAAIGKQRNITHICAAHTHTRV